MTIEKPHLLLHRALIPKIKMEDKEKELIAKRIRLRAVILKDRVLDVKRTTGIDMREEIIEFFRDRFGEKK